MSEAPAPGRSDAQILAGIILRQWTTDTFTQPDEFLAGALWSWTGLEPALCRAAVDEARKTNG